MKRLLLLIMVALGVNHSPPAIHAQQNQPGGETLTVLQVQPDFHVIAGAGGNIAVQIGPDGVVLVDAGTMAAADAVVAAIKRLTDAPIRYILNTSPDPDHVGGNEKVAKAGVSLFARQQGPGGNGAAGAVSNGGFASIVGPETLLARMSTPTGNQSIYPVVAWPTETFSRRFKDLFLNREGIQVIYEPAAHTDSDSVVVFRRSDVVVTGDIFDITRFPVIDVDKGGSINGEIAALNHLLELTIPSIPMPWLTEGGTQVIPGHGRPCEEAEIVEYRDMVTIIRDRIRDMMTRGMTLDQIKAANPTSGWRRRFGSDSGPSTTNMFVEAIYRNLSART